VTTSSGERAELAAAVSRLVADRAPLGSMPDVASGDTGYDSSVWRALAEYGFLGLLVPESLGGSGATLTEAAVVATELGRQLVPGPYISSAVESTTLLVAAAENGADVGELLAQLVSGTETSAVIGETATHSGVVVTGDVQSGLQLDGEVSGILGADSSATLLVVVSHSDALAIVCVRAVEVTVTPIVLSDVTRRAATVRFESVVIPREDVLLVGEAAREALDLAAARAAVAIAADSVGGAAAALVLATEYAKTRHQFGRAIGSFQAIKHKLATMYIASDSAQAVAEHAAASVERDLDGSRQIVLAAAAHCTAAYVAVAGDAIQTHGGIGFTWEHACHRYLKRAWLNQVSLGGQRALRASFADRLFNAPGRPSGSEEPAARS